MSDFSIRTSTLRTRLSSAFDKNSLDFDSDTIQKSELADYLLNDLQDDINSLKSQQQDAQIDFNGIKLPVGESYENVSDALNKLQQQQAVLGKMLFVQDSDGQTLFDKLDTNGDGLSKAEFNALDVVDTSTGAITDADIDAWFSDDSVSSDFADTLTKSEKSDLADDNDISTSGTSTTDLLLGLLTGQTDTTSLLTSLLGDDDSDDSSSLTTLLPLLMGNSGGGSNSISSMLPLLLLSQSDSSSDSSSLKNMLPLMLLSQGGGAQGSSMSSMLPLLLMSQSGSSSDSSSLESILPMMLLSQGGGAQGSSSMSTMLPLLLLSQDSDSDSSDSLKSLLPIMLLTQGGFGTSIQTPPASNPFGYASQSPYGSYGF